MGDTTRTTSWTSKSGTWCLPSPSFGGTPRLKWSGHYVFLGTVDETMALIGTMPARLATTPWKAKTFTLQRPKLRFYHSQDSTEPHRNPGDLPAFDQNDWHDAETAEFCQGSPSTRPHCLWPRHHPLGTASQWWDPQAASVQRTIRRNGPIPPPARAAGGSQALARSSPSNQLKGLQPRNPSSCPASGPPTLRTPSSRAPPYEPRPARHR